MAHQKLLSGAPVSLFRKRLGDSGPPLIILHGMFGMSDNWQTLGRRLSDYYRVFLVDARNHGRSPHTSEMNYDLMAEDVGLLMEEEGMERATLMGHSMGGKTAMAFAAKYPERMDKIVVVDIAPRAYPPGHLSILEAFTRVDLAVATRQEIEAQLMTMVPSRAIALFLMKNLKRCKDGGFEWKLNLQAFKLHYPRLIAAVDPGGPHGIPALLVKGGKSAYVSDRDFELFKQHFPRAVLEVIPGAGHWVHAEQPEIFYNAVFEFLEEAD